MLARCLSSGPEAGRVDDLTVGDREALLLHLRRLTFGSQLDCLIECPAPDCGARMELELDIDELLVPAYAEVRPEYDVRIDLDGERHDVRFRLPTAADLDAAARVSRSDPERGATEVLRRCVIRATTGGRPVAVDQLGDGIRRAVATAMADHDPQAELELDLTCPTCSHAFAVIFDSAAFLIQELDAQAADLLQDVHALALQYHWSEQDILALPPKRRERYLELLDATLRGSSAGDFAAP